jgi:hypothetical protein
MLMALPLNKQGISDIRLPRNHFEETGTVARDLAVKLGLGGNHCTELATNKQSLLLDLHLIALSFWIRFQGKWETRGKKA